MHVPPDLGNRLSRHFTESTRVLLEGPSCVCRTYFKWSEGVFYNRAEFWPGHAKSIVGKIRPTIFEYHCVVCTSFASEKTDDDAVFSGMSDSAGHHNNTIANFEFLVGIFLRLCI